MYRTPFPRYKVDFSTASFEPKGAVFFDGPNPPHASKATLLKGKGVYAFRHLESTGDVFFANTGQGCLVSDTTAGAGFVLLNGLL
jgi:hypothetical protein